MKAIILNDTRREIGHLGCLRVMSNLIEAALKNGIFILDFITSIDPGLDEAVFKARIEPADVVIVNGEGTLHHGRGKGLYQQIVWCAQMGKKVHLINSVWQSNECVKEYLNHFDSIHVRESLSLKALQADGWNSGKVVPDLSLYSTLNSPAPETGKIRPPAVIDSVDLSKSTELFELSSHKGYSFYFMGRWHRKSFIKKRFPHWILGVVRNLEVPKLLTDQELLSSREFVVSGRFHGVCLSMLSGVPVLSIESNTHKTEGMMIDAGIDTENYHLKGVHSEDCLIKAIRKMESSSHDVFRCRSADYIKSAKVAIDGMFAEIKSANL